MVEFCQLFINYYYFFYGSLVRLDFLVFWLVQVEYNQIEIWLIKRRYSDAYYFQVWFIYFRGGDFLYFRFFCFSFGSYGLKKVGRIIKWKVFGGINYWYLFFEVGSISLINVMVLIDLLIYKLI